MSYLSKAVDTVRKQENRALAAAGDKSLAGTKYLWLYSAENLPERHADRFATLRTGDLKTARAWAIKESLRHLWNYRRRGWAAKHFKRRYFWATHSRLKPVIEAAKTLKRHEQGILAVLEPRRLEVDVGEEVEDQVVRMQVDDLTRGTTGPGLVVLILRHEGTLRP